MNDGPIKRKPGFRDSINAGSGVAIGAGVGAAFGVAFGNLAVGIAAGVGIGALAGGIFARKPEPPSKTDAPVRKPEDLD